MKFQVTLCVILFLGAAMASQEVQQCILDSTTTDIFGEITEIRTSCGQNSCMDWFNNRSIDLTQSTEEIKECFQICGLNSESFVNEFITEVIINGCILSEELLEEFEVASEEYKPKLRAAKPAAAKESSFISKFISNIWGNNKTEEDAQNLRDQFGSWGSWGSWDSEYYYYGSWGSWGSWDSEYYYYPGTVTFDNEFSNYAQSSGKVEKETTSQFLQNEDGDFGSVVQYEVKDHWTVDGGVSDSNYGSINLWFDSYAQYYGSIWGSSFPILYEEGDYELNITGDLTHKTVYTLEEQQDELKQKIDAKGLKVPEELKGLNFGSDYQVTDVNESWEWDLNKDGDVDLEVSVPMWGSGFGSFFGSLF